MMNRFRLFLEGFLSVFTLFPREKSFPKIKIMTAEEINQKAWEMTRDSFNKAYNDILKY